MLPNIWEVKPNKISSDLKSKIFWFHGEPGTWKTTVASQFPKAFIAGFEIGYQFIDGVCAVPMTNWSDMKDLYRQLKSPKAKETYDTIVFDTISNAATMCYKYALGSLGVDDPSEAAWGKGWRAIKDEWRIIKDISKLGYCIVFISHSKETEITDTKTKQVSMKVKTDLEGWSSDDIWGLSDFVFYVRKELQEDGTEQVYAYSDYPNIDTKRRHPAFPSRFLFSYDNIIKGLDAIVQVETAKGNEVIQGSNIREVKETSWIEYRDEVISIVKELSGTNAEAEMTRFITEMFPDTRLSETSEIHKEKLMAARDYLIDLKTKIN